MRRAILALALIVLASPAQGEAAARRPAPSMSRFARAMRIVTFIVVLVVGLGWTAAGGQQLRSGVPPSRTQTQEVTGDRIERLHQWLAAVDRHEPGVQDDQVSQVGAWTNAELRGLWIDVYVLAELMRNIRASRFLIASEGQRNVTEIRYTNSQIRRMRLFACAASGALTRADCFDVVTTSSSPFDDLRQLAQHAAAERLRSRDDNYVVRRGALLHADVAMMQPRGVVEPMPGPFARPAVGPQAWRIDIQDGRGLDVGLTALHWDIGRLALDQVKPRDSDRPAPQRDDMVRAWYRATAAWMQYREDHDTLHLDRARAIFPDDADLLFLSGCQRETYAAPAIQAATRSVTLPPGVTIGVDSDRGELRRAETFFKRALAQRADMGEAHLRLGRVLGLQGHHTEASAELQQALTSLDDPQLQYYGELFRGAEEEALGHFDAARVAFIHAATLFPSAQSPLIALSELAKRRGDRVGALAAMEKVFALSPAGDEGRDDPWWVYHVAQARNADELLDALRRPFRRDPEP